MSYWQQCNAGGLLCAVSVWIRVQYVPIIRVFDIPSPANAGPKFWGRISKNFLPYRGRHPWTTYFTTGECFNPSPRIYTKLLRNHTRKLSAVPGKLLSWSTALQPDGFSVVCIRHFVSLQLMAATSEQCATCYRCIVRQLSEQLC